MIPDRSYALMYEEIMSFCRLHGQFDVSTMGNVANIGLMAQKAEEYGSHDKTFEIQGDGRVQVVDSTGAVLFEHQVENGDIWRMCQTKDAAVRDWVKLAVRRAKITGMSHFHFVTLLLLFCFQYDVNVAKKIYTMVNSIF